MPIGEKIWQYDLTGGAVYFHWEAQNVHLSLFGMLATISDPGPDSLFYWGMQHGLVLICFHFSFVS